MNKQGLTNRLHSYFEGQISKQLLDDAISVITESLADSLLEQDSISIDNFGTMHSYIIPGHVGHNVVSGEMQYVKPKKSIKLAPHITLSSLLEEKKPRFKGNNS